MSILHHAPVFNLKQTAILVRDLYDLAGVATPLPSERDQNFLLTIESGERFVLKIANALEQRTLLEAQNEAMRHLQSRVDFCPRIVPARSGDSIVDVTVETGVDHMVRLVTFIHGVPLANVNQSARTLRDLGEKLGKLTQALSEFDNPAFHREFHWDLANASQVINEYSKLVREPSLRRQIEKYIDDFQVSVTSRLAQLPRSVIHGDANDYNVIVEDEEVVGLIDFGDVIHSYTVGDLAIAIAYIVLDKADPLLSAKEVVRGYIWQHPLKENELEVVWWLALMRLCMSVCLAAHQQAQKPENVYLDIRQRSIRNSLPKLLSIDPSDATQAFRRVR